MVARDDQANIEKIHTMLFVAYLGVDEGAQVMCGSCGKEFKYFNEDKGNVIRSDNDDGLVFTVMCPHCNHVNGYYNWYNW